MIAAAEQSKNFSIPFLYDPIPLDLFLQKQREQDSQVIFFDPEGVRITTVLSGRQQGKQSLTLMVGPEGDLSEQEKDLLRTHNVLFCCLTPTVLRS